MSIALIFAGACLVFGLVSSGQILLLFKTLIVFGFFGGVILLRARPSYLENYSIGGKRKVLTLALSLMLVGGLLMGLDLSSELTAKHDPNETVLEGMLLSASLLVLFAAVVLRRLMREPSHD